jgi:hypothetical protein
MQPEAEQMIRWFFQHYTWSEGGTLPTWSTRDGLAEGYPHAPEELLDEAAASIEEDADVRQWASLADFSFPRRTVTMLTIHHCREAPCSRARVLAHEDRGTYWCAACFPAAPWVTLYEADTDTRHAYFAAPIVKFSDLDAMTEWLDETFTDSVGKDGPYREWTTKGALRYGYPDASDALITAAVTYIEGEVEGGLRWVRHADLEEAA